MHPPLFFFVGLFIAALIASSNTCFKPDCVRAEHSRYFTAPTCLAMSWADETSTIFCSRAESCFFVCSSLRRSALVPTSRMGTPGAWCWISGTHFVFTFSYELMEITEKHTRKTSVWG